MFRPLALRGEGLHFAWVKAFSLIALMLLLSTPSLAQVSEDSDSEEPPARERLEISPLPPLTLDPDPLVPPDLDLPPPAPVPEVNPDEDFANDPAAIIRPEAESSQESADTQPDYSRLSAGEERAARLDDMFARLVEAETEEAGRLIAEEIWAIWLDSGSASVNLIIRRGTGAQSSGNIEMARIMFDHVTRLAPGFAEGWARSSRLSLEEGDFSRAVGEAVQALSLEPRHFYALWTLGNVLEQMGRTEEALDAYREANRLYPALETVSDRISALELRMGGAVL